MIALMVFAGVGTLGFFFSLAIMIFFGKVIMLQLKIWALSKKGYHMIEHVGEDNIRRYFYMRPKDNHFEFNDGFYLHIPETITKREELLKKVPEALVKKIMNNEDLTEAEQEENKEIIKLVSIIKNLKYDREAVSLSWGIPIITYYGDNPNPVLFRERTKIYSSGVIRDMYLRLLLTLEHNRILRTLTMVFIAMVVIGLILIVYYAVLSSATKNVSQCQNILNYTTQRCIDLINRSTYHAANTTINLT
jgi:hypothetical protein